MAVDVYTIKLKSYLDVFIERLAGGTLYPGMLVLLGSGDTVVAHDDDAPAAVVPMFAIEDAFQGKGINDAYASGDVVRCWVPTRGDVVYGVLEDGANVAIGAFLESNGAGMLQAQTGTGHAIGIALEALDLSGSSGEEDSEAPWGYAKRIKLMVI